MLDPSLETNLREPLGIYHSNTQPTIMTGPKFVHYAWNATPNIIPIEQ
jgi:hypothetical protein